MRKALDLHRTYIANGPHKGQIVDYAGPLIMLRHGTRTSWEYDVSRRYFYQYTGKCYWVAWCDEGCD